MFDFYKSESGVHLINMIESAGNKVAFKLWIDIGTNRENATFDAEQILNVLSKKWNKIGKAVEYVYAGVVGVNMSCNRAAFTMLRSKYPKLFFVGCIAHFFDLLNEDIYSIDEIDELISYVRNITKFVKTHKYVQAEFKNIIGQSGIVLKLLFRSTRFSYAELTLVRCLNNKHNLEKMVDDENWLNVKQVSRKRQSRDSKKVWTKCPFEKWVLYMNFFAELQKLLISLKPSMLRR